MPIRFHHLEITAPEGCEEGLIQVDPEWLFECLGELALQMEETYPNDHNLVWTKFPIEVINGE